MSKIIRKVYHTLKPFLSFLLNEQKVLDNKQLLERIFAIADKYMSSPLEVEWREKIISLSTSQAKYDTIKKLIGDRLKEDYEVKKFEMEFVVGLLYPKLDAHVSAQTNHLLKSPFNFHHDSQKLSVPLIDVASFDVDKCILLSDIQPGISIENVKGNSPYSLGDYLRNFEKFLKNLEIDANNNKKDFTNSF